MYLKLLRGMLPPADMRSGVGFAKLRPARAPSQRLSTEGRAMTNDSKDAIIGS